jgi:hypothetical protein
LIFDRIVGSEDNYRCYRQRWDDAPGLPHIYPHIYGQYSEEKKQDFFRFHEYVEWRSRGKEDNLTSHVNQNSDIPSAPRRPPQHYFPRLIFSSHNHAASTQSHLHLENGSQYEPHSQRRTCPTGLYSALTVLRREMQSWTCCNSGGFSARGPDHKLGVDSQWVTTKLDALKTPWRRSDIDRCRSKLPDTKHSQTPRSIASPSSSYASASRDPGEDSPIHNAHRLPYSGIAAKREPPVDNATLGHVLPLNQ